MAKRRLSRRFARKLRALGYVSPVAGFMLVVVLLFVLAVAAILLPPGVAGIAGCGCAGIAAVLFLVLLFELVRP